MPRTRSRPEFIDWLEDQLQGLGRLRARAMFGGWGLYLDELFFALLIDDELYIKADAAGEAYFAAAGSEPFFYARRDGRTVRLGFWRVPAAIVDDAQALRHWARLGLAAALAARR